MKRTFHWLVALLISSSAQAAYFMDAKAMQDLLPDFEDYQNKHEIRYLAKAAQFTGYVTGIVDGQDGNRFCLPGGVDAQRAALVVAEFLRSKSPMDARKGVEVVSDALAERYPCTH